MKIKKVINNNVVSALDSDSCEVIVMGRGVGFQARPGMDIPPDRIQKIFKMDGKNSSDRLQELLKDIPMEHFQLCSDIIEYAKAKIGKKLNKNIYITLTDHVNFAIERYRQGMNFSNPLLHEVKLFYKNEFAVGEYALSLINERVGALLPADEAASIALHIVNAEYDSKIDEMTSVTRLISSILNIVEKYFNIQIDEQSLDFERFLTHLKFFAFRIFKHEAIDVEDSGFRELIEQQFAPEYRCSKKIAEFIEKRYRLHVQEEELYYLAVHIKRVTRKSPARGGG
ncbi:MAG TPA: transcription antiterminator BglG [Ruminococcaceae bacterium]|nr:transcription antiterminator BglG [Oscillospiraceae bacterium]